LNAAIQFSFMPGDSPFPSTRPLRGAPWCVFYGPQSLRGPVLLSFLFPFFKLDPSCGVRRNLAIEIWRVPLLAPLRGRELFFQLPGIFPHPPAFFFLFGEHPKLRPFSLFSNHLVFHLTFADSLQTQPFFLPAALQYGFEEFWFRLW